jgi:hypothetical protein
MPVGVHNERAKRQTGQVDIVSNHRVRQLRKKGMPFRAIAASKGVSLTAVRAALRDASARDGTTPTRTHRELRREIRRAGGLGAWWKT